MPARWEGLEGMVGNIRAGGTTVFDLVQGVYLGPSEFFPAGDIRAGQALLGVLGRGVRAYLKVMDPYISPETLRILVVASKGTEIRLICHKPRLRTPSEDLPWSWLQP